MKKPFALIVEDDQNLTFIFSKALQEAGFETGVVRDGDAALTILQISTPDLVLLDLHLPRVSGKEIVHVIRADKRLANTRIIISTGDPLMASQIRDNVELVLLKPVSFIQLRDLASRLNHSRANVAAK